MMILLSPVEHNHRLLDLAGLFLKLGLTAFGGPAAHIALMQQECVKRRQWLSETEFLDLVSAANLIPGPNSTELAIHIGYRRAGASGLIVAGLCFILPAVVIVTIIAAVYVQYGQTPQLLAIMTGIKPVMLAIILQALLGLGRLALHTNLLRFACLAALTGCLCGAGEITVLLVTGLLVLLVKSKSDQVQSAKTRAFLAILCVVALILLASDSGLLAQSGLQLPQRTFANYSLFNLFVYFVQVGSVLYGSGYVLVAFLQNDLVRTLHWLTTSQLLDATAIGQVTPGPVFTTATFIGYMLGGINGAMAATCGIFLPAFGFVAITAPCLAALRQSRPLANLLDGVNSASLALMIYVALQLTTGTLINLPTWLIFAVCFLLLQFTAVSATWLIALGAMTGYFLAK